MPARETQKLPGQRPIGLATGQFADLPLATLAPLVAAWGYDGLELAAWGDHLDVDRAAEDDGYVRERLALLEQHGLRLAAINESLVSQCICDNPIDERHRSILPASVWGDGNPEGVRQRAAERLARSAHVARALGVGVVKGLTGSRIWQFFYSFPPVPRSVIEAGYRDFGDRFAPIMDVFASQNVKFAMEPHPTSIAYDVITAAAAVQAVGGHPAFGFNADPSHFVHQDADPCCLIDDFPTRVFGVHIKDTRVDRSGRTSRLGSHLDFGDPRRGWDFCSAGRGDVPWERFFRAINRAGYRDWLVVEWEDPGMDRQWGAREALTFAQKHNFPPSDTAFDAAFLRDEEK